MNRLQITMIQAIMGRISGNFVTKPKPYVLDTLKENEQARKLVELFPDSLVIGQANVGTVAQPKLRRVLYVKLMPYPDCQPE